MFERYVNARLEIRRRRRGVFHVHPSQLGAKGCSALIKASVVVRERLPCLELLGGLLLVQPDHCAVRNSGVCAGQSTQTCDDDGVCRRTPPFRTAPFPEPERRLACAGRLLNLSGLHSISVLYSEELCGEVFNIWMAGEV